VTRWWDGDDCEHYWLEATDRSDIGTDLRAPLTDSAGRENWRYTLLRDAKPGDLVFHYDGKANAITSVSTVAGAAFDRPIVWAARGSYARERGATPVELPGYAMPLSDHRPLATPLTLDTLRAQKPQLEAMVAALRHAHGRQPFYFPFELSARPVRPMQGYAFKLPAAFVRHFGLIAQAATLTISDNATIVRAGFDTWRAAVLDGARREGDLWVQSGDRFVFRNQPDPKALVLGARTALGIDPTGRRWAVQINEADSPGDANVTSAVALDEGKRPFLLRQGRLNPPTRNEDPVLYAEFKRLTGLTPADVTNGNTNIERDWYVVTALDVPTEDIRANTGRFVDACVIARSKGKGAGTPADLAIIAELNAHDETGGTYIVGAQAARDARVVRKWQGEVWTAMAKLLRAQDFAVEKPRPAGRYEVDAEIVRGTCRLLVEIKTGAAATDIYGGLGQLLVYAKLLPRLAKYQPVLLLPALPAPPLVKAIEEWGVALCTFDCVENHGTTDTTFSPEFLKLCGLNVGA
jgi:predicted RNA-binding protein with PUA-like domain